MTISDVIQALRTAPRFGADTDQPEGSRYIQISDTFANEMAQSIEDTWLLTGKEVRLLQLNIETAIAHEFAQEMIRRASLHRPGKDDN